MTTPENSPHFDLPTEARHLGAIADTELEFWRRFGIQPSAERTQSLLRILFNSQMPDADGTGIEDTAINDAA
jgi:hypothetical protein